MIIRNNFVNSALKHNVVTPHLNRLIKTALMRGVTTYGFSEKLEKLS